jgi:hypothetical protein
MKTPITKYTLLAMDLPPWYSTSSSFPSSEIVKYPRVIKELTDVNEAILIYDWSKGTVYSSFGNQLTEGSKSIVKYNGYVYVCSSNNIKNLKNQSNASNYPPSSGILEDGYQWVNLFQIDISNTGNYIKIPSYDKILDVIKTNEDSFCTTETIGKVGDCSLYLSNGSVGKLIGSIETDCVLCNKIANALSGDTISAKFYIVPDISDIPIITNKEKLNNILDTYVSKTDFSVSAYKNNLNSGFSAGCIFSVNIDPDYLYTGVPTNLVVNIVGSGSGATVELVYSNIVGSTGDISGIEITNRGTGYQSNTTATITGLAGTTGQNLANAISLIIPSEISNISDISSIFDLKSSFPTEVVTHISGELNPKLESITCNAYTLLINQIDNNLPPNITGVRFFTPDTVNASPLLDQKYKFNFIRA